MTEPTCTLQLTNSDHLGALTNNGVTEWIGTCAWSGNVTTGPGSLVRVLANASFNTAVTAANGFTNSANIELLASGAATAATLNVTAGTLVNAPTGVISSLVASGGARNLNAKLDNQGTITVAQSMTTNKASVQHLNSGTINLTTGNYTVILSGTTPSFTTTGTIDVPTGRTLTLQGGIAGGAGQNFYYAGGTMGGAGTVALLNSTLNLTNPLASSMAQLAGTSSIVNGPSTLTVSAGTTVTFSGCTINATTVTEPTCTLQLTNSDHLGALTNNGVTEWIGTCAWSGNVTTGPGSLVRVLANASFNTAVTAANGFTNSANIELLASGAATAATLNVTAGTLVNAPTGVISSLVASGGARNLNAKLDNQGTITVAQSMTTNKASVQHLNSGTINLTTGNYTVILSGTTPSFTTTGDRRADRSHADAAGWHRRWCGPELLLRRRHDGRRGHRGAAQLHAQPDEPAGQQHGAAGGNQLDRERPVHADGERGDHGDVLGLHDQRDHGDRPTCTLQLTNSDHLGALTNNGVTEWIGTRVERQRDDRPGLARAGAGERQLQHGGDGRERVHELGEHRAAGVGRGDGGDAERDGGHADVNAPTGVISSLVASGGARNLNAKLDNQGTITVAQSMTTNKASVQHLNSGTINLTTGNYTVILSGTTPSFTTTGTIDVPTGRTLTLQGGIAFGAGQNYFYNGGTMGGAGTVALVNANLVLNAPLATAMAHLDGTQSIVSGPALLTVSAGTTVPMNSSVIRAATQVDSAGTLRMTNSDQSAALTNAGLVEWIGTCIDSAAATTTTTPNSTMRVLANASFNSLLTAVGNLVNHGALELTSSGAATAATLTVNGGTLTNSPTGRLSSLAGAGGARSLLAPLANQGVADFQATTTLNKAAAAHTNAGTLKVSATRTLTVTGASFANQATGVLAGSGTITLAGATAFTHAGTVRPGASPGVLTLNTGLPSVSSCVFDVELGGDAAGTGYDQLVVRDPVTLAGTLNVTTLPGFVPQPGLRYVIAKFPSRTGTFATVNGLAYGPGQLWMVAYSDTDVVLLAMDQTWTKVIPDVTLPSARDGHTAVYDSTGDRMIVFGGQDDGAVRNDVWVLTKATSPSYPAWIALAPTGTPPAPRTHASAVYDPATNRMIVYGGDDGAGTPVAYGDAWVLTNANGLGGTPAWLPLAATGAPAARSGHAAAYDRGSNRMIVFGGNATPGTCGGALADVQVLANANGLGGSPAWTALAPTGTAPSARWHHGAAYDDATGRLIVTGGEDGCGAANTEAWLLDGANGLGGTPAWTAVAPTAPPAAGWSLARYAYDAGLGWTDAFGGKVGGAYVDTAYTLTSATTGSGSSWYRRAYYGTRPPARAFHSMIVNGANHVAVVFGGQSAGGRLNDTWRRQLNVAPVLGTDPVGPVLAPQRTAFALPPSPNPARGEVAMAVDVARAQKVELGVFDVSGRRVATIHSGRLAAGRHAFRWNGVQDGGRAAAPGVYLVRMAAEDREQVVRLVRLK